MYSVNQPWDPLRVCVVGRSYSPEFYKFIENPRLRELFQKIARETEEDYQAIIKKLEEFGVQTIRPYAPEVQLDEYLTANKRIPGPISMTPRDQMIMIGNNFFVFPYDRIAKKASGKANLEVNANDLIKNTGEISWWSPIVDAVAKQDNPIIADRYQDVLKHIPANGITRIGNDLYFGRRKHHGQLEDETLIAIQKLQQEFFSSYRCHWIESDGHIDGFFCPVKPGLILSIRDEHTYTETFPGWEVVYLEGESWGKILPFLDLKKKNQGKWWIKGSEYDNELIDYVETWLGDWVGYCEESVFDVNILVINEHNVMVSGYNKQAFDAFERHGVTPHIVPFRHRYFWDGGLHCVTLDLHRDGAKQDFFPDRGSN